MKSIYASKLYKASKRKGRINAALIAPTNLFLVQQLADSLDEEFKTPENFGIVPEEKESEFSEKETELDDFLVDEDIDPEKDLVTMDNLGETSTSDDKKSASAPKHEPEPSGKPEPPEEDKLDSDVSELMPESPANESNSEPLEAFTEVPAKEKVTAATILDLTSLKATLNSREETTGVTRIAEKENEIWIYYNDDTNLNEIMTDVIEYLMNNGYDILEFNRLARSDNAIVFLENMATANTSNKEEN